MTAAQWTELKVAQQATVVEQRLRERLEMVRRAARSIPIPQVATDVGGHPQTVRRHVKAFLAGGVGQGRHARKEAELALIRFGRGGAKAGVIDRVFPPGKLNAVAPLTAVATTAGAAKRLPRHGAEIGTGYGRNRTSAR